jgi:hypothetical protein
MASLQRRRAQPTIEVVKVVLVWVRRCFDSSGSGLL